jgi:hypothetical protein
MRSTHYEPNALTIELQARRVDSYDTATNGTSQGLARLKKFSLRDFEGLPEVHGDFRDRLWIGRQETPEPGFHIFPVRNTLAITFS